MSEDISSEEERQQRELRSLIAGLSQHLDDLYTELEACEEEMRKLRKQNEEFRAREKRRYLRRLWNRYRR
jgi:hypothetical protein